MKFRASIDIDQSLDVVTDLFADPNHLKEYQDGFVRKELISGEAGQAGAVSKMYYQYGKRDMELTETITANDLPHSFEAVYHHKHMDNNFKALFTAIDASKTRYEMQVEYTRINWVMPKLMAILFPSIYRKQGQKWMDNFKRFAESQ